MKRESIDTLEFRNLSFSYNENAAVLDQVDYKFPVGEALFLKGSMGSGKSTVMKILTGLIAPQDGEYLINGTPVNGLSHAEFDKYRLNMGYSFDIGGLINNKSLLENMLLPLNYHGYLPAESRVDYIKQRLSLFHLEGQSENRPGGLSNGAKKAASLLKAFILNPEMVVLNDPTLGLSSEHIIELLRLIREHQAERNLKHLIIASDDTGFIQKLKGTIVHVVNKKFMPEAHHLRMVNL